MKITTNMYHQTIVLSLFAAATVLWPQMGEGSPFGCFKPSAPWVSLAKRIFDKVQSDDYIQLKIAQDLNQLDEMLRKDGNTDVSSLHAEVTLLVNITKWSKDKCTTDYFDAFDGVVIAYANTPNLSRHLKRVRDQQLALCWPYMNVQLFATKMDIYKYDKDTYSAMLNLLKDYARKFDLTPGKPATRQELIEQTVKFLAAKHAEGEQTTVPMDKPELARLLTDQVIRHCQSCQVQMAGITDILRTWQRYSQTEGAVGREELEWTKLDELCKLLTTDYELVDELYAHYTKGL